MVCLVWGMRWSIFLLTPHFFIWFVEWNELIHKHLIPHKLIISICMRNGLIPPKLMGWTHDASPHEAWDDSTNQTHHKWLVTLACYWLQLWATGCHQHVRTFVLMYASFIPGSFYQIFVQVLFSLFFSNIQESWYHYIIEGEKGQESLQTPMPYRPSQNDYNPRL